MREREGPKHEWTSRSSPIRKAVEWCVALRLHHDVDDLAAAFVTELNCARLESE